MGRAAIVALPILGVIVVLLASADAVFAGMLQPDIRIGPAIGHVILAATMALVALTIIGAADADTDGPRAVGTFGTVEVVTMLSLAAGVLALFVVSQLVALTGTGDRLVAASGSTPAEQARGGFFQLCWATALLLGYLGLVHRLAATDVRRRRAVRTLGALVPILALGLVVVSLRRMAFYDQAFGLTMLRLWVVGAAVWLGMGLAIVAFRNGGGAGRRRWALAGSGVAALALVLVADLADPEAFVVRHNVARARAGVALDGAYLRGLSDDAVPAAAHALEQSPDPAVAAELRQVAGCRDGRHGVAALNLAATRAEAARLGACPPEPSPRSID